MAVKPTEEHKESLRMSESLGIKVKRKAALWRY